MEDIVEQHRKELFEIVVKLIEKSVEPELVPDVFIELAESLSTRGYELKD